MASQRTVFNHVGLCVADRGRSRRFYEGLLGFEFWWELEPPDDGTDQLLQLEKPVGLHATYLVRDGLVLELLDYSKREVHTGPERVMDQVGLTHLSLSVSDLAAVLTMVDSFGGSVVEATVSKQSAMIRDPDGAADRAAGATRVSAGQTVYPGVAMNPRAIYVPLSGRQRVESAAYEFDNGCELDGWMWNGRDAISEKGFRRLLDYVGRNGDALVPKRYKDENGNQLGVWVMRQRKSYAAGTLDSDRERRLREEVPGWTWRAR